MRAWSWLHYHLVNAQIMACVYIYFPRETVEQSGGFDTTPSPAFLMNGFYSVFLHFPQDTAIKFDRWYVRSLKQWSWAQCHWKLVSHTHPFAPCLSSIYPLLSAMPFPVAPSQSPHFLSVLAVNIPLEPSCHVNPVLPRVRQLAA